MKLSTLVLLVGASKALRLRDDWDPVMFDSFDSNDYTVDSPDGYNGLVDEVVSETEKTSLKTQDYIKD